MNNSQTFLIHLKLAACMYSTCMYVTGHRHILANGTHWFKDLAIFLADEFNPKGKILACCHDGKAIFQLVNFSHCLQFLILRVASVLTKNLQQHFQTAQ